MSPSKSPPARAPRGFTLVELLVGAVTTTIILSAVAVSFMGVQGTFQRESRIKVAVEGLRTATDFIEQRLRLAGYGVDPRFAFDFNGTAIPLGAKSNFTVVFGNGVPHSITDDLAFRYRDAAWMRRGHFAGSSGIVLENPATSLGMDLTKGQRLIVSCVGGKDYLVLTVGSGGISGTTNAAANLVVDPALSSAQSDAPCLYKTGDLSPFIMLLREVRIRIVAVGGRPFLMAFQGLDELDMANAVPLAADVESFQVAYVMNRPSPDSPNAALKAVDFNSPVSNWVMGDVGSPLADSIPESSAQPVPQYKLPYEDPSRFNRHPANIRAVRVSIGIRSTSPEPGGRRAFERVALEDSGEAAPADGYYRTNMTTTVRVPNLQSRSAFNPPVVSSTGTDNTDSNVWGG